MHTYMISWLSITGDGQFNHGNTDRPVVMSFSRSEEDQ